ncbi:MAG: RdgB/HAM1 family non-canonical purine NTP pyrophosphatase [Clostridiales Family XIII bacterium]|jgi:XTP/dITP diphosphohydrolase|nr:RdgB/HAM1 family non-canonical purine NTP pyrophosphatase [Clostridiales Family XIII bacterium]
MEAPRTIIAATTNAHKIIEIDAITREFGWHVISRKDAGIPDFEVEEDGLTFEENSLLKAQSIFSYTGRPTIADDSGLAVDALDGAPGVFSARFAGEDATDADNNAKLLRLLENVETERRTARYVAVITLIMPDRAPIVCRGEIEGHIALKETGTNGFGYDPMFIPNGYEESFGVLPEELKNKLSHRYNALLKLKKELAKVDCGSGPQ